MNVMRAGQEAGPEFVARASRSVFGKVYTLAETACSLPAAYEVITRHAGCKDLLSVTAVDPDGCGPHISMASDEIILLDRKERLFWQMLGVHLAPATDFDEAFAKTMR